MLRYRGKDSVEKERKPRCPECKTNQSVIRYGNAKMVVQRKPYKVQRYRCNECYRTFVYTGTKGNLKNA